MKGLVGTTLVLYKGHIRSASREDSMKGGKEDDQLGSCSNPSGGANEYMGLRWCSPSTGLGLASEP